MIVTPYTHIRIGNDEQVSLKAVDGAAYVELVPRFADRVESAVEDGTFEFPHMTAPEVVEVRWLDEEKNLLATTCVTVVQRQYFPLEALRSYGDGTDDFSDYSDENAHRSFVLQLGRKKDYGRSDLLTVDHNDVDEVLTPGYVQVSGCQLERSNDNVEPYPRWVDYVYGFDYPPTTVSQAALMLTAYALRPSNRPLGATGESSDAGYIHFTLAGRDGATNIPEVNAVIEQFGAGVRYVL